MCLKHMEEQEVNYRTRVTGKDAETNSIAHAGEIKRRGQKKGGTR